MAPPLCLRDVEMGAQVRDGCGILFGQLELERVGFAALDDVENIADAVFVADRPLRIGVVEQHIDGVALVSLKFGDFRCSGLQGNKTDARI